METSLACSSAAAATFFALSFFSLSALPRVSFRRRSTSAAHCAFVQPGGLCFGARGFLAFGMPSMASFFGGMVVEGKRRICNCGGEWRLLLRNSAGKMVLCGAFWRENEINGGNNQFCR